MRRIETRIARDVLVNWSCIVVTLTSLTVVWLYVVRRNRGWDGVGWRGNCLGRAGCVGEGGGRFLGGVCFLLCKFFDLVSRLFITVKHTVTEVDEQTWKRAQ